MKKNILTILLSILTLFIFSSIILAKEQQAPIPKAPETIDEAEKFGLKILSGFPEVLKKVWQEARKIGQKIFEKIKFFWNAYIKPHIMNLWNKIKSFFAKEVEKRKPEIQQELEKEKKEMKEEIPKAGKSIWQRFKDLIRWWKED